MPKFDTYGRSFSLHHSDGGYSCERPRLPDGECLAWARLLVMIRYNDATPTLIYHIFDRCAADAFPSLVAQLAAEGVVE